MLEMFIHRQPWHPRQSATATRRFSSDEQKIWSVRRIQKYVDTFPHLSDATERLLPAVLILLMKLHHRLLLVHIPIDTRIRPESIQAIAIILANTAEDEALKSRAAL